MKNTRNSWLENIQKDDENHASPRTINSNLSNATNPFQHQCALCLEDCSFSQYICDGCFADLPHHNQQQQCCRYCATPIDHAAPTSDNKVCGQCQISRPALAQMHASFSYLYPLDYWLKQIKQQQRYLLIPAIAQLMLRQSPEFLQIATGQTLRVCYVPSSASQLLRRGFNLAEQLARYVAHEFQLPLTHGLLKAYLHPVQKRLKRQERLNNSKHSFALCIAPNSQPIIGDVLLIDDVMTSGATLNYCAQLLKSAGAKNVYGWTLARTVWH